LLRKPAKIQYIFAWNAQFHEKLLPFPSSRASIATPLLSAAQSSESRGFEFGINFGVYVPSKYNANYYNGSEKNLNNTQWVLKQDVFYDTIFNRMNAIDTVYIQEDGWPTNMHYKLAMMPGIYGQYTFNELYSCIRFQLLKLVTLDALVFTCSAYASNPTGSCRSGVEKSGFISIRHPPEVPGIGTYVIFLIGGLSVNKHHRPENQHFTWMKRNSAHQINQWHLVGPNTQTLKIIQEEWMGSLL
jgi:hypothetical protein